LHRIALPVVSEWCQMFVQSKESPRIDFLKAVQSYCIIMSNSLELDCRPEALTMSMLPPWPIWMDS